MYLGGGVAGRGISEEHFKPGRVNKVPCVQVYDSERLLEPRREEGPRTGANVYV